MTRGMRIRRGVLSAALCLGAPSIGLAQRATSLPDRLQPATRSAIELVVDSARASGLPVQPLYSKAAEGVTKNADDARILIAVRRLARELGDAREALGTEATEAELVAGASALHAGVHGDALRRMRAARTSPNERAFATALVVLADLITRGVPANLAATSVHGFVARGARENDFLLLRQGVERDIQAGQPPASALETQAKGLRASLDTRKP